MARVVKGAMAGVVERSFAGNIEVGDSSHNFNRKRPAWIKIAPTKLGRGYREYLN
jgi:hypothetical protein